MTTASGTTTVATNELVRIIRHCRKIGSYLRAGEPAAVIVSIIGIIGAGIIIIQRGSNLPAGTFSWSVFNISEALFIVVPLIPWLVIRTFECANTGKENYTYSQLALLHNARIADVAEHFFHDMYGNHVVAHSRYSDYFANAKERYLDSLIDAYTDPSA